MDSRPLSILFPVFLPCAAKFFLDIFIRINYNTSTVNRLAFRRYRIAAYGSMFCLPSSAIIFKNFPQQVLDRRLERASALRHGTTSSGAIRRLPKPAPMSVRTADIFLTPSSFPCSRPCRLAGPVVLPKAKKRSAPVISPRRWDRKRQYHCGGAAVHDEHERTL